MTTTESRDDLLDRLVAEYADLRARDAAPERSEFLERQPPEVRADLARCLRMMEAADDAAPSTPAAPAAGARLGDFRILREIGRGGMGVVYEAEQEGVARRVALKVLRGHLTLDRKQVDRFGREARAAGRLRHPAVVAVHAVGEADGHHFIAMDLAEGPSLARVVERLASLGRAPDARDLAEVSGAADLSRARSFAEAAVRLLLPVLDGVQAAHDAGLVHRDLKPSNVLLGRDGAPRVADFGLARADTDAGVTATGEPVGTPHYMSPEQARAAREGVDARTDVYSLGVTLYELLTLRVPFRGDSVVEVLGSILRDDPPPPRSLRPDLPPALEAVVLKAMAKDPAARYATPRALADDLRAAVEGRPVTARVPGFRERFGAVMSGRTVIRSTRTWRGRPLVHVTFRYDPETRAPETARGWIAVGGRAVGGIAVGGAAAGIVAIGGTAVGLLSFGGLAIGGLALGGGAIGLVALGGGAAGVIAVGGGAFGWIAAGGDAHAAHALDHARRDPVALEFFREWAPWVLRIMRME